MAAYVIVDVQVTDAEKYAQYRELSTKALAAHGGEFLVRGGELQIFEGDWQPGRIVIVRFDTLAGARAWYDSPEYGAARAARDGAAVMKMLAVQGV
jgi:uncharacterized protein (DUF1330 family)